MLRSTTSQARPPNRFACYSRNLDGFVGGLQRRRDWDGVRRCPLESGNSLLVPRLTVVTDAPGLEDMKNIQVIDGAQNCSYEVFSISDADFALLFPLPDQDVEFSDEFFARLGAAAQQVWSRLWRDKADKKKLTGIHGTLFCGLAEKKQFYPTKREAEMITGLD